MPRAVSDPPADSLRQLMERGSRAVAEGKAAVLSLQILTAELRAVRDRIDRQHHEGVRSFDQTLCAYWAEAVLRAA